MTRLPGECEDACCCVLNFLEATELVSCMGVHKELRAFMLSRREAMNE